MSVCSSYIVGKSNPTPKSDIRMDLTTSQPVEPIPEPDPLPSTIAHLIDSDGSFMANDVSRSSRKSMTEVGFLGRLSHPNIVKLLGYCKENENFLIVYELMQKGRLNYHLFGKSSDRLLPWKTRIKIMMGMAKGLCYLHTMEKPIIYRDFKSSNVILNQTKHFIQRYQSLTCYSLAFLLYCKISNFGLAMWGPADNSYVTAQVAGKVGYIDPEYVAIGKLYVKSDVYSFGVVSVEMLTGLRPIDKRRPLEQENLVNWAKPSLVHKRRLRQIMDPRLEGRYSIKEALQIAQLAYKCLNENPIYRPSMKEVAEMFEQIGDRYIIGEA
ncbi:probable serine/threonine-protein kinase PIX13 [Jatropha curcas]|uniref:probable serine/threonine-protein kinase PIX13 n=1 Tax=Jatropha curcas TaxID=180498 RepID=UPI001894AE4F|nr:probable serine/threonine-protein kinase PIX13 [Jatropha curcas]